MSDDDNSKAASVGCKVDVQNFMQFCPSAKSPLNPKAGVLAPECLNGAGEEGGPVRVGDYNGAAISGTCGKRGPPFSLKKMEVRDRGSAVKETGIGSAVMATPSLALPVARFM